MFTSLVWNKNDFSLGDSAILIENALMRSRSEAIESNRIYFRPV